MSLETRIAALATEIAARFNARKRTTVPLGRWEETNAGGLVADNIFDDAIYSHYTITGQFLPVTNGAVFQSVLRDGVPADVGGGLRCGGPWARSDESGGAVDTNRSNMVGAVSSTYGIADFTMNLRMGAWRHAFSTSVYMRHSDGRPQWSGYAGAFLDSTPRQGIKFYFSSGNIAEGWMEIVGHLRQAP